MRHIYKSLSLFLIFTTATITQAYGWDMHWIKLANSISDAQIWFRRTYILQDKPEKANIRIACCGKFILYVNGRNVTADILLPNKNIPDAINITDFNVSRFLKRDSNTIAVWYSPASNAINDTKKKSKQISVQLYGTLKSSRIFSFASDSTWLCREANAITTSDGDEIISGPDYISDWKEDGCPVYTWSNATQYTDQVNAKYTETEYPDVSKRISHIYQYKYFDTDETSTLYDFGHSFNGWIRLTLRGMQQNSVIGVNGCKYICTGKMDEQVCRRFTTSESGRALVTGPEGFSISQIMKIEAIKIVPFLYFNFLY